VLPGVLEGGVVVVVVGGRLIGPRTVEGGFTFLLSLHDRMGVLHGLCMFV